MADKKSGAKLILEVEFDGIPSQDNINEIIDLANTEGSVTVATLKINTPAEIDVRGGWN